ncbi:MAG TPA: hypothetical protein VND65_02145 [Candidatus Binatia bacterium]|nr:hypothetical protein [Candidatus Binatia bacterium]
MARSQRIPALLLLAACCQLFVFPGNAAEKSPWSEVHSQHFTVITDGSDKEGREVALRFEQMRSAFATLLMKERPNDPVPLTILAFRNDKDYYRCAPLQQGRPTSVPGFFVPGSDQNFFVLNLFEPEPWRAVTHQFAHLLVNYNYPPVEGWFDEGLAEYFSSVRVDNKQIEIGGDPELQSIYKEDLLGNQNEVRNPPKSLTELLGAQVWLSVPDLFTMKHDTSGYAEGTHRTLFYAQSWITMHYLIHEKKLPETGTYFGLVENQHVPVEEAIQKAYGMSAAEFDKAVKDYFHSLTPLFVALDSSKQAGTQQNPPPVYTFPETVKPDDNVITVKPIAVSDAMAIAADVKVRVPDHHDAGLQELQALASAPNPAAAKAAASAEADKNSVKSANSEKREQEEENAEKKSFYVPGDEIAHRALAWQHLEHGAWDAAAEELGNAASLDPRDMWIRYYSCVMKYRMAMTSKKTIQGLPNMMQDLRAVLEWYPEFADAYDLLAVARTEGGGATAALQAERAAMQLSPRDQQYVYHLAEIYVEDKKWDAAHTLLDRLKANSNPQIAGEAREELVRIADEQKYGVAGSASSPSKQISKQSSPFDVLEEDAAKRTASVQGSRTTADNRPAKFFQGRLVGIDCSQSPAAVLTVTANGVVLKLRTPNYKSLLLIGADSFSCEWNDRSVSVNYKPGGLSDGDLLSVEVR